jgi:hypothetical protein
VQFFLYSQSIYVKLTTMAKKDTKQLLFENMEKLNPDFKVNEVAPQPVQAASGDVANLQKAVNANPTIQYADSRIDTPQELEAAFGTWISRTGYGLQNKPVRPISISQVQTLVKNAMQKLGYK